MKYKTLFGVHAKVHRIDFSRCRELKGDPKTGKGGIYNFVTKRGTCLGNNSKISWTQVETGSALTWKYPGCILKGDGSVGEFYSVALSNNATHRIVEAVWNGDTFSSTTDLIGSTTGTASSFINFWEGAPIIGVNLLENLLFFTDYKNKKIIP